MKLVLSEEERMLGELAGDFFEKHGGVARFRAVRDGEAAPDACWREMGELGWLGATIPEAHGGAGLGLTALCQVLEQAGRALAPEPLLPSLGLAAEALRLGGSDGQRAQHLPALANGQQIGTLAWQEDGGRYDPARCTLRATRDGDALVLIGSKRDVLYGAEADLLLVSARVDDDSKPRVIIVPGDADGLTRAPQRRVDSLPAARLTFDGVRVGADQLLPGADVLARALDHAAIALAAEMLGGMSRAFEMTLEYLRERRQFGVAIGTFQALQHRAARVYTEIELVRSSVLGAARLAEQPATPALFVAQAASLAKARAADAYLATAEEAVQMHGGIGMTDEHDVGLFLKRAHVAAATFGDAAYHRARWATLMGY